MDKNEVMKTMVDVRFEPFVNHQELKEYQYINASDIVNLGAIAQIVPSVMEGLKKNEGLYKVIMPKGAHLAKDAHGLYLGGTFDSKNHLIGQARWQKVEGLQGISPEVLSSGVACVMIIAVEHELNEIKEMQKQILSYLEEKDIAELVSNTSNLQDIQKDYKYNLEDEKYITVSLNQVQNIKHHSKKMMEFYKHRITKLLQSNDLIHVSINAKSLVDKVSKELRNECIALFNYVYSLYLQVMLLGNFNESYLHKILDDIDRAVKNYEQLYKQIDQYLEKYTKDSFDHQLMNGLADAHKFAGDVINKVPVLGDTPIQYVIKDTGKNIKLFNKKEHHQIVKEFQQYKDISVKPFVKSLEKVDAICNKPMTLLIAEDKIYFKNRG